MKHLFFLFLVVVAVNTGFSQIPIKQIEEEIVQLISEEEISAYWETFQFSGDTLYLSDEMDDGYTYCFVRK